MSPPPYPTPQQGASMMLAFRMTAKLTIVVGAGRLAASRAFHALEAGSRVLVLCDGGAEGGACCEELRWRAQNGEIEVVDLAQICGLCTSTDPDCEAAGIERFISQNRPVSLVCVTDTLLCGKPGSSTTRRRRSRTSAMAIHRACRKFNIPLNVADMPDLCDFTFCTTHRFHYSQSAGDEERDVATPLQLSLTTNGEGCRLAGRLKRELVHKVHKSAGMAVEKVGRLRNLARARRGSSGDASQDDDFDEGVSFVSDLSDEMLIPTPNTEVSQREARHEAESDEEFTRRRMKWVAQISEFWSLDRLASLDETELDQLLNDSLSTPENAQDITSAGTTPSKHDYHELALAPRQGEIFLVGSGPGHPSFLTVAAHTLLTSSNTHLVLTDKLVPSAVLELIPKHIQVRVARKFPGNAEGAQSELMDMAVAAARAGKNVVRLKQGDPMVYGRAGEEILYFRAHNIATHVVPGISAALAAPLCAGIPVTQRGVAEGVVVCTGVGRGGKGVKLPGYERARTVVVLMAVARLAAVVDAMLSPGAGVGAGVAERGREGAVYPPYTPVAIIERAAMPDQRVVSSTLENIVEALESTGEQRPPGLMVVGWAVSSLWGEGVVDVLKTGDQLANAESEADEDNKRISRWLSGVKWRVEEGFPDVFDKMGFSDSILHG